MPPETPLAAARRALDAATRGDWDAAHAEVQAHEGEPHCDWVHAHLHRMEGDAANAAYWYRQAGQPVARGDLAAERIAIAAALRDAG